MQVDLLPILDECKGTIKNGVCSTDPQGGRVPKRGDAGGAACCAGVCDERFELDDVIEKKDCDEYDEEVIEAIELPERGRMRTGTRVQKGSISVVVANVDGSGL